MICSKCSEDNLLLARYCGNCGHPFSEAERKKAYDKTVYGKVDAVRKAKDVATLSVITDSLWFKILTIVLILALGIWLRASGAHRFRLESSDLYEIRYLEETDTYYLIAKQDEILLRLAAPGGTKELTVEELDEAGEVVSAATCSVEEGVTLSVSGQNHYRLSISDGKKTTGTITLYLYSTDN